MRQIVVEAEVRALGVHQRHAIADIGVVEPEGLLHPEERFKPANQAVEASEGLRTVVELDPIALRVLATIEFRAQAEGGILRFPPEYVPKKFSCVP